MLITFSRAPRRTFIELERGRHGLLLGTSESSILCVRADTFRNHVFYLYLHFFIAYCKLYNTGGISSLEATRVAPPHFSAILRL